MNYKKLNNLVGWIVFLVATIVYFLTIESTASLWDCGEYITAAYKLEVGHPPGAPLFMALGRLFSLFASSPETVAVWINRLSALSSSFTILFMYWSITMLAKKMLQRNGRDWSKGDQIATVGAGIVGALAYTFSDSFWFSAVEGEVYAMSSLFTAAIFWAILKWDSEMTSIRHGEIEKDRSPMRWMVLIMFLFGLAIGVHLLGLLVVPSIAFVIYFNYWEKTDIKGILLTGVLSVVLLGFIQEGIIPGIIAVASGFEVTFVNSFGLPFFSGTFFFFIALIIGFIFGLRYAVRKGKPLLSTIIWCFAFLLIGYGSFAVIVIRSNANTPLDENDPENLVTLHSYLKREQYGSWPILNGPYWNSKENERELYGSLSPFYVRRFVVMNNMDEDVKAFKNEKDAQKFMKTSGPGYQIKEKFFVSNESIRKNSQPTYAQNTFLPRMYYTGSENDPKVVGYKNWSGYNPQENVGATEIGKDGNRLPTFGENMTYMMSYQVDWMYWRYFMWNFSGKQNDFQGHGDQLRGNYLTGYNFIDEARLGSQENAPFFTSENKGNNNFFMFPLILGIVGMIFHFYRAPKDAFVVFLTFLFTGLAIVIYLNQKPLEPRERDYAYAASFFAFAFWIGISVIALYEAYKNFSQKDWKGMAIGAGAVSMFMVICALMAGGIVMQTWIVILVIGAIFLGVAFVLRKVIPNNSVGAVIVTLMAFVAPAIMGNQGWDDHNRDGKTSARDLAHNYLSSCAKNSILFSTGDNDTFPLWYYQEVEGKSTDVRVCNTSLFDTDWYTVQMKMKMYDSDPLPIKFNEDQILMFEGSTDQTYLMSTLDLANYGVANDKLTEIFNLKKSSNLPQFTAAYANFVQTCSKSLANITGKDATIMARVSDIKGRFTNLDASAADWTVVSEMQKGIMELIDGYRQGAIDAQEADLRTLQEQLTTWEDSWGYLPIDYAMEYARNDDNLLDIQGNVLRVIPSNGFILPVDTDNALKSGVITKSDLAKCSKEVRFQYAANKVQYVTKSDLMILDMLANNDWKRAMYFTAPGNTETSIAIYQGGFLRSNGMAWEITPVQTKGGNPLNMDVMYHNMMEVYSFGDMKNPDVLTDYYARHQTTQFRSLFLQLAENYLAEAEQLESNEVRYQPMIANMRQSGNTRLADSLANTLVGSDKRISENKKRAKNLILKSIEEMPASIVLDYGERANPGRGLQDPSGNMVQDYTDGTLHDYVAILYRAGAKDEAEKLGIETLRQIESIINYFRSSEAKFAGDNHEDFGAAVRNLAILYKVAADPEVGNPNGVLASKASKVIEQLYNKDLPRIYNELKQNGIDNGETTREQGGNFARLNTLRSLMDAMNITFQLTEMPGNSGNQQAPSNTPPIEGVLDESALTDVAVSDDSVI